MNNVYKSSGSGYAQLGNNALQAAADMQAQAIANQGYQSARGLGAIGDYAEKPCSSPTIDESIRNLTGRADDLRKQLHDKKALEHELKTIELMLAAVAGAK